MSTCKLSVIVICLNSVVVREACLGALTNQSHPFNIEILAVGHWDTEKEQLMFQKFPEIRWLTVSAKTTVPQMRTHGILHGQGEIIALLEDDCMVTDDWYLAVFRAHQSSHAAIGGAVLPGSYRRLLDWAVYFCEYARFMAPFAGVKNALPGNHVTYKHSALPQLEAGQGFYEIFFHADWLKSGGELIADPALAVENINQWSLRHVTYLPFHHGRAFAGMRAAGFSTWRRGLYTVFCTILPALKIARLAREVAKRRRYAFEFFLSIPWILIFMSSWSLGELFGYAAGPGHSPNEWR